MPLLPRRPASLFTGALLLCGGCATPYELRDFFISMPKAEWGSMYLGLRSNGRWREGQVDIEGTPYTIHFAPRLKEAPAPDCALQILNLRITPEGETTPVLTRASLDLAAGPPRPNEPNWRAHSPHFYFVPLEEVYLAGGSIKEVDLPYRPLRATFELKGNAPCAPVFHTPIPYDLPLRPHVWKGKSGPWPSV